MKRPGASAPIGVFDSGVGGLTVYRALRRALPAEDLVYFGDTARVPYGTKTKEAVTRFSLEIARFLEGRGIKFLVVACNTASSLALPALKRAVRVPVVGVIEPAARAAAASTRGGTIGVIGTEATVSSGAYQKVLKTLRPRARVAAAACPLFVPLVEEGWWDERVTEDVARRYLAPLLRSRIDALILGCTHYPLMKPLLRKVAGAGVRLVDSGEEAAREVAAELAELGLAREAGKRRRGKDTFFVTDGPERFGRLAARFLRFGTPSAKVVRFPG